ncbi:MAG: multiheme c-type cytochrome [Planctomycetota bacterium]
MRRWMVPVAVGLLGLAATLAPRGARAQEPTRPGELHLGAGSCAAQACHGGASDARQEYKIWATRDRHSRAYEALTGERGQRIGKRLGRKPTEAPECLSCHGTTGVKTAVTFDPNDGVSCELCHGGAQEWLGAHITPAWKKLTPAAKEGRGFRDLTTPAKRAEACVGCHVAEKGRDITHAIVAAGHPPLVFDAAKFLEDMPPHWSDEDDLRVATWVEGLKANAAAVLGHVERTAQSGAPDFTVFDCYSCHHPVYTGSVYEKSEPPGRPGDLPLELSSLKVLLVAAGDEALRERFSGILSKTHAPGDSTQDLVYYAGKAAAEVSRLFPDARTYGRAHAATFLLNIDAYLERVAAGHTRTPRAEMQQFALAIHALAARHDKAFRTAFAELDRGLQETKPYAPAGCAKAARAVIAAGK